MERKREKKKTIRLLNIFKYHWQEICRIVALSALHVNEIL